MHKRFMACALAALAVIACTPSTHVTSDYDRSATFGTLQRFVVVEHPHPAATSPLMVERTYEAIRAELTSKGFTDVDDVARADFTVDFQVGARDRVGMKSFAAPVDSWLGSTSWVRETDAQRYPADTLTIEVSDLRSRRLIWTAEARKDFSGPYTELSAPRVREAIAAVFAGFPPK